MSINHARTPVTEFWIAHAIELIEESGPLDDEHAMAQAFRMHTSQQQRLLERAWILGEKLGLDHEIERWKHLQWIIGSALCLLIYLTWGGLMTPLTSPTHSINAVLALTTVLLVPSGIFFFWLLAVVRQLLPGGKTNPIFRGRLFWSILTWIPLGRTQYTEFLARSALVVLQKNRLTVWFFGLISHALWSVLFLLVLLTLRILFEFEGYDLYLKTTTGDQTSIDAWIRAAGQLPAWLGFPGLGSATLVLNEAPTKMQSYALGWWVMGCTFTYGLLPRLAAFISCFWILKRRKSQLQLATQDPYFRRILVRFEAMEPMPDEDLENPVSTVSVPLRQSSDPVRRLILAVIGFELPDEFPWPARLADRAELSRKIAGSFDDRRAVLKELAQNMPNSIIVVCDATSSPDRGTGRFLREVASYADQVRILLTASAQSSEADVSRWTDWLATLALLNVAPVHSEEQAMNWLDQRHDQTH